MTIGLVSNATSAPTVNIRPATGWSALRLGELWKSRELLFFLVWRDLKVRYKQTVLGAAWAIVQPLLTMAVFTVVFGRLARLPSDDVPYAIFALTGLVPWTYFSSAITASTNSLVANANLLRKVYFPRLILPLASVSGLLLDLTISLGVLLVATIAFGFYPTPRILFVPFLLALPIVAAAGLGLWLSALNLRFRDIRYVVPFLTQLWMFATPIVYPSSLIKNETLRLIYAINPMAGTVEGLRWALLGTANNFGPMTLISSAVSIALLLSGALYFQRSEGSFADLA